MVTQTSGRSIANDEWQTAAESWAAVADLFAAWRTKRVWHRGAGFKATGVGTGQVCAAYNKQPFRVFIIEVEPM
jgi:hypothetical protein